MRKYTNKQGESITVSQEHLDTAIRLKRELQMESPSHKCSWKKHKTLMESEGFFDSEISENYRMLIKNHQSSVGELPSVEKHADLIADSKLQSIKEAVGEMAFAKREVQLESQKLGKLKRDLTLYGVVAEQFYEALVNELNMEVPKWIFNHQPTPSNSSGKMVVLLSDWHIGAVVNNVNGNSYNYEIAKKRVQKFAEDIKIIANKNKIYNIEVVCLGDMTEHVSMRSVNQAFESEFTVSEQTVKAFELIRDFLTNLSKSFNVTYRGISGNHDRMNGRKEDNIDGDSTIYLINYLVKLYTEMLADMYSERGGTCRVSYVEADNINYSTTLSINGVNMKFVHGDNERGNRILASHSALDGVVYNLVAMGHLHHFSVTEVGLNQFEAYFGSLMGMNNYGKKGKFGSTASQGVIIVDEFGEMDIKRVGLQLV
jgi:predicted phosphodiesterase